MYIFENEIVFIYINPASNHKKQLTLPIFFLSNNETNTCKPPKSPYSAQKLASKQYIFWVLCFIGKCPLSVSCLRALKIREFKSSFKHLLQEYIFYISEALQASGGYHACVAAQWNKGKTLFNSADSDCKIFRNYIISRLY